jgi:hypothetical protein
MGGHAAHGGQMHTKISIRIPERPRRRLDNNIKINLSRIKGYRLNSCCSGRRLLAGTY